jgi:hypothetical protein
MFFFIVLSHVLFGAGIKSGRATRREEGNYHKTATTKAFAENLRKMRVRVIYASRATYPGRVVKSCPGMRRLCSFFSAWDIAQGVQLV